RCHERLAVTPSCFAGVMSTEDQMALVAESQYGLLTHGQALRWGSGVPPSGGQALGVGWIRRLGDRTERRPLEAFPPGRHGGSPLDRPRSDSRYYSIRDSVDVA